MTRSTWQAAWRRARWEHNVWRRCLQVRPGAEELCKEPPEVREQEDFEVAMSYVYERLLPSLSTAHRRLRSIVVDPSGQLIESQPSWYVVGPAGRLP